MMRKQTIACTAFLAAMAVPISALAQSYRVTEDYKVDNASADAGPVRMARFAMIKGKVAWRPSVDSKWSAARTNLPCRQGAQIMVSPGGRCELQFDDGSMLRMGSGSFVTLSTLYSDANGEFTEAKLNDGLATFDLRNKYSLYQIDTPDASCKAYGPAELRFGVSKGLEIADRKGECEIDNSAGQQRLGPNQYAYLPSPTSQMRVASMPKKDDWDHYNDERETYWQHPSRYEPSNIGLVSGDLDNYGRWRHDSHYGDVWYPTERDSNWRPYEDGNWTWVSPYGWTWVGNEPWGWAPYHYGAWIHTPYGWAWDPGPEDQYWDPAVVRFTNYGDNYAWCPLDPDECRYPDSSTFGFSLALGGSDWGLFFSIGRSGEYFPAGPNFCEARPWSNVWVNQATNYYSPTYINNYYSGYNPTNWATGSQFVPRYARYATFTNRNGFVNGAPYRPIQAQQVAMFQRGRGFTEAPTGNDPQIFGPANLRPNRLAYTPTRHTVAFQPNAQIMNRPVFRSAVPNAIARQTVAMGRVVGPRTGQAFARNTFNRPAPGMLQGGRAQRMVTRPNPMQRYNNLSKSPFTRQNAQRMNATRNRVNTMRQRPAFGRTAQVRSRQARPILPNMHRVPGRNAARTVQRTRPNFGRTAQVRNRTTQRATTMRTARPSQRITSRVNTARRSFRPAPRTTTRPQRMTRPQRTFQQSRQQVRAPRQNFAPRQNNRPQRFNPAPRQQSQPRQQFRPQQRQNFQPRQNPAPRQNFRPNPSPRQNRPSPQRSKNDRRGHGG